MYEQMERLVRLNVALATRHPPSTGAVPASTLKLDQDDPTDRNRDEEESASDTEPSTSMEMLQRLVVEQAKEIQELRAQLKTMIPSLPLDGSAFVGNSESDDDEVHAGGQTTQSFNRRLVVVSSRKTPASKLPLTSLKAQLEARDRQIKRLELYVDKLETQLAVAVDKKRVVVQQYQQITSAQQTQLKRYFATIQKQRRGHAALASEFKASKAYITVLESKLLAGIAKCDKTRESRERDDLVVHLNDINVPITARRLKHFDPPTTGA